jgi:hypothetical protein
MPEALETNRLKSEERHRSGSSERKDEEKGSKMK